MSPAIKFGTLENIEIIITSEDAKLIAFESSSFSRILSCELQEDVFEEPMYGGEAINLALKYCKKYGELFETEFKEEQHLVDGFISQITEAGLGMVHELVPVLYMLDASRLFDLTCQYITDDLSFKDYGKFREAFGLQFLFPPYFGYNREIQDWEHMFDELEYETHTEFDVKIPFTPKELELAELENKSVRVGGNLKYKTKNRLTEELLIKIEYIERRLNSFQIFSFWMDTTLSKCHDESTAHLNLFFDRQSDNDIDQALSTITDRAIIFDVHIMHNLPKGYEGIADSCTNYENIDVIGNEMDKNESIFAGVANTYKKKEEELVKCCLANWKNRQEDKIYPWLTYFLENCYQEIRSALCALRGWMSPHEVQHKISKLNNWKTAHLECMEDGNEYQDKDVESEAHANFEYMEDEYQDKDVESEVQAQVQAFVSQKAIDGEPIGDDVVSSLRNFQHLAIQTAYEFPQKYHVSFRQLQKAMRKLPHLDLLIKDEEILTFICKSKLKMYMKASEGGTRTISFADVEKEFDRIMEETDEKFGDRGPAVEEAKKKYSLYYKKFHYAMVDETERQMKLLLDVENGSLGTEKESLQVKEGRRKRKRNACCYY